MSIVASRPVVRLIQDGRVESGRSSTPDPASRFSPFSPLPLLATRLLVAACGTTSSLFEKKSQLGEWSIEILGTDPRSRGRWMDVGTE